MARFRSEHAGVFGGRGRQEVKESPKEWYHMLGFEEVSFSPIDDAVYRVEGGMLYQQGEQSIQKGEYGRWQVALRLMRSAIHHYGDGWQALNPEVFYQEILERVEEEITDPDSVISDTDIDSVFTNVEHFLQGIVSSHQWRKRVLLLFSSTMSVLKTKGKTTCRVYTKVQGRKKLTSSLREGEMYRYRDGRWQLLDNEMRLSSDECMGYERIQHCEQKMQAVVEQLVQRHNENPDMQVMLTEDGRIDPIASYAYKDFPYKNEWDAILDYIERLPKGGGQPGEAGVLALIEHKKVADLLEQAIPVLFEKFGSAVKVLRASLLDDYQNGIDLVLYDVHTKTVLGVVDVALAYIETPDGLPMPHNRKRQSIINRNGDVSLRYGVGHGEGEEVVVKSYDSTIPIYYLACSKERVVEMVEQMSDSLGVTSYAEEMAYRDIVYMLYHVSVEVNKKVSGDIGVVDGDVNRRQTIKKQQDRLRASCHQFYQIMQREIAKYEADRIN